MSTVTDTSTGTDTNTGAGAGTATAPAEPEPLLSPGLRGALETVRIASDGLTAWVGEDEVTAESPSAMRFTLARTLYEVLHTGRGIRDRKAPKTLRAPEYEARLAAATPHATTVAPAILTDGRTAAGRRVVEIDGLRLNLPDSVSLEETGRTVGEPARPVVRMTMPAARPLLSPGFFLVDSGKGRTGGGDLLRVYLRVNDAEQGPVLWNSVLSTLESRSAIYRAKIISNPGSLPRNDGMVVYLSSESWGVVDALTESAVATGLPDGPSPAYAHVVAPGVTAAWEPKDDRAGMRGLSFGEHRSHVVARAFVAAAEQGRERPTAAELSAACAAANVDPADPARNLDSAPWPWTAGTGSTSAEPTTDLTTGTGAATAP
ncbi:T3SS effector HopA1 family protein [Streptomyces sp. NBC_01498]|uniref:T3SS effector HopA1 family protein n=1 Tax=Streptomyces sp. NBC_01498 TaxID=2975870 RepID=UPI002E7C43CB|nr:T3SS effector HopA1 family protein [Streptomyces sp. NBC_01498]WTL26814.1 T3SS effector HopA1 family protein [Streptomyces sp. NBC_01498]